MLEKLWKSKEFKWQVIPFIVGAILSFIVEVIIQELYPIAIEINGVRYIPYIEIYPFLIICISLLPSVYIASKYIREKVDKEI